MASKQIMSYHSLSPKTFQAYKLTKDYPGKLRVSLSTLSGDSLDMYLITADGYNHFIKFKSVLLTELRAHERNTPAIIKDTQLDIGLFFVIVHNKNDLPVPFELSFAENRTPPVSLW
jgi:hypothetical protein